MGGKKERLSTAVTRSAFYISHRTAFFFPSPAVPSTRLVITSHTRRLAQPSAFYTHRKPLKIPQHAYQKRPQFNIHPLQKSTPFRPTKGNGSNNSQTESYRVPGSCVPTCTADTSFPSFAAFTRRDRRFVLFRLNAPLAVRRAAQLGHRPACSADPRPKLYTSRTRSLFTCSSPPNDISPCLPVSANGNHHTLGIGRSLREFVPPRFQIVLSSL